MGTHIADICTDILPLQDVKVRIEPPPWPRPNGLTKWGKIWQAIHPPIGYIRGPTEAIFEYGPRS